MAAKTLNSVLMEKAISSGDVRLVQSLLEKGADPNEILHLGEGIEFTPLQLAVSKNRPAIVRYLVQNGADVNKARINWTPLIMACQAKSEEVVSILLSAGADVNLRTGGAAHERGETALMAAATSGHLGIVRSVLAAGADCKVQTPKGRNVLSDACEKGNLDVIKLLVKAGSPILDDVLFRPIADGRADTVKFLVKNGADVNAVYRGKRVEYYCVTDETPLGCAVRFRQHEIIRELVKAGTDIDQISVRRTPLNWAVVKQDTTSAKQLLKAGANVNLANREGVTPLATAVCDGNSEMVKLLLAAGANPRQKTHDDLTPIELASQFGQTYLVPLLERAGPKGLTRQ